MTWSMRMAPACRSTVRSMSRYGLYAARARASGRHGGCDQFCPCWLYMSGGAPTVAPRASTSPSAHTSAPCGCTPTARSCMMPSAMPPSRAARWAAASCSSATHCSHRWNSTRSASSTRSSATSAGRRVERLGGPAAWRRRTSRPARTRARTSPARRPPGRRTRRTPPAGRPTAVPRRRPRARHAWRSRRRRGRWGRRRRRWPAPARTPTPRACGPPTTGSPPRGRPRRGCTAGSRSGASSAGTATASAGRSARRRAAG